MEILCYFMTKKRYYAISLVSSLSIVENDETCSSEDRNRCTREDTFGQRYHIDHVTLRHRSLSKIGHSN